MGGGGRQTRHHQAASSPAFDALSRPVCGDSPSPLFFISFSSPCCLSPFSCPSLLLPPRACAWSRSSRCNDVTRSAGLHRSIRGTDRPGRPSAGPGDPAAQQKHLVLLFRAKCPAMVVGSGCILRREGPGRINRIRLPPFPRVQLPPRRIKSSETRARPLRHVCSHTRRRRRSSRRRMRVTRGCCVRECVLRAFCVPPAEDDGVDVIAGEVTGARPLSLFSCPRRLRDDEASRRPWRHEPCPFQSPECHRDMRTSSSTVSGIVSRYVGLSPRAPRGRALTRGYASRVIQLYRCSICFLDQ
jgi:hypothetical protein